MSAEVTEREIVERLRMRYESEGFEFIAQPDIRDVPEFFGGYRPDALALKPGQKIAIEVKTSKRALSRPPLRAIHERFAQHPDWQFRVLYVGDDPTEPDELGVASAQQIQDQLREVLTLRREGHTRAAFLLAWSLLEAAVRSGSSHALPKALPAGSVVRSLAADGEVDFNEETRLRALALIRNRIAHGDLNAPLAEDAVGFVSDLVLRVLAPEPSAA